MLGVLLLGGRILGGLWPVSLRSLSGRDSYALAKPRPLVDFDSANDRDPALAVRPQHDGFAVGHRAPLGKCPREVRHVRHDDRVCSLGNTRYCVAKPRRLRVAGSLHALATIAELLVRLRVWQLRQSDRFPRAIRWTCQDLADRDLQITDRQAHGRGGCASGCIELALELNVVRIGRLLVW